MLHDATFMWVKMVITVPGILWLASLTLTYYEFLSFKYSRSASNDLSVASGHSVISLRALLKKLLQDFSGGRVQVDVRMVSRNLVMGTSVQAALGLTTLMKAGDLCMPSLSEGVAAIEAEFRRSGTAEDIECFEYVAKERAGSSRTVFSNGNLMRDCDANGRVLENRLNRDGLGMTLDEFVRHPSSTTAGLKTAEVLALRLYTTAAFKSLNNPLRDTSEDRPPHPFPCTVNYIRDAIGKLRAVEAANGDLGMVDLWRGMKNVKALSDFLEHGGTELAPMSTTGDLKIALEYALGAEALLLKVRTKSFMQRGASLSYLSAFPAESEILYPPLTYLKPTGRTMEVHGDGTGAQVVIVEVEPFQG